MAKVTKNKTSIRGKTLTYTIKYSIDLDDIELESFIQDELDQLRGMGTVEIENVEVEE
jgi:hypothetical protein